MNLLCKYYWLFLMCLIIICNPIINCLSNIIFAPECTIVFLQSHWFPRHYYDSKRGYSQLYLLYIFLADDLAWYNTKWRIQLLKGYFPRQSFIHIHYWSIKNLAFLQDSKYSHPRLQNTSIQIPVEKYRFWAVTSNMLRGI